MSEPQIVTAEACAWCDMPERGHGQRWTTGEGWHGYVRPSTGLIEARMWRRLMAKMLPLPEHADLDRSGAES